MAPFICECEGKSYGGWFNKKTCKECNTIIHFYKPVAIGGNQWRNQRIKDLEDTIKSICSSIHLLIESENINIRIGTYSEELISLVSRARKDIEDNQYKRR